MRDGRTAAAPADRRDGRGWSHNRHFHCAPENICIPRRRTASPRVREMECLTASSRTQKSNLSSLFLRLWLRLSRDPSAG